MKKLDKKPKMVESGKKWELVVDFGRKSGKKHCHQGRKAAPSGLFKNKHQ